MDIDLLEAGLRRDYEMSVLRSTPLVFIAHPLRGDLDRNLARAAVWVRWVAIETEAVPVAPYFAYTSALKDSDPRERELGMTMGRRLLLMCDELWLCGNRVSKGMRWEKVIARKNGIKVVNLTDGEWLK